MCIEHILSVFFFLFLVVYVSKIEGKHKKFEVKKKLPAGHTKHILHLHKKKNHPKHVKHHQKGDQQHNNTLSAHYLVCTMISVCVHSSIPLSDQTEPMVNRLKTKGTFGDRIYLQMILRLFAYSGSQNDDEKEFLRKSATNERRNAKGEHHIRTINTYLLNKANANKCSAHHKKTLNRRCVVYSRIHRYDPAAVLKRSTCWNGVP